MPNRRQNRRHILSLALAPTLVLCACTSIPKSPTPVSQFDSLSCAQIDAEMAQVDETKRVATQARDQSWYVIVPVLVAARYVDAKSALPEADERAQKLNEIRTSKACAKPLG